LIRSYPRRQIRKNQGLDLGAEKEGAGQKVLSRMTGRWRLRRRCRPGGGTVSPALDIVQLRYLEDILR
jgi:hypothetical protein